MMYDGLRPCGEWNTNGIDPFKLIKDCIFAASVLSTLSYLPHVICDNDIPRVACVDRAIKWIWYDLG
jgi:hypothetical protein